MPAGNASNTVFTAIPVGEDFSMSFSTERFFHNIVPADISNITFKLYDARIIGSVGSPNPSAIIETVVKSTTPGRFSIDTNSVRVSVTSASLDSYENTRTSGAVTVFRGELYAWLEVAVVGEEAGDFVRLPTASSTPTMQVPPATLGEEWWDGYLYAADFQPVALVCNVASATLSLI